MKRVAFLALAVVLLFASCGQQHEAESLVKDFLHENLIDASNLADVDFKDIDSTRYLNDSLIANLRRSVRDNAVQYKKDIQYGNTPSGTMLMRLRVTYKVGEKNYVDTYYINKEIGRIVAFMSTEK